MARVWKGGINMENLALATHLNLLFKLMILNIQANGFLKALLKSIDFIRSYEYPKTISILKRYPDKKNILDIGSFRTILPVFIATQFHNSQTIASDIHSPDFGYFLDFQRELAKKLSTGGNRFKIREADATHLCQDLADFLNKVDVITAISVIEHIPYDGDILAVKEFAKMLSKGGIAIISVPYGRHYNELKHPFFERIYDKDNLNRRLIESSGLTVVSINYHGCRNFMGALYGKLYLSDNRIIYLFARAVRPILFPLFPLLYGECPRERAGGALIILMKK
jgi:SAM-dependent methyltransferase